MNSKELANRLRIAREVRGMTINDVAQAANLNKAVVGRMCGGIEKQTAQAMNFFNVRAYANAVNMPVETLCGPLDVFAQDIARMIMWHVKETPDGLAVRPRQTEKGGAE